MRGVRPEHLDRYNRVRQQIRDWYLAAGDGPLNIDGLCRLTGRTRVDVSDIAGKMGLTRMNRPLAAERKAKLHAGRERYSETMPHPRLGKPGVVWTPAMRERHSKALRGKRLNLTDEQRQARSDRMTARHRNTPASNAYSRAKHGRREDLGNRFFRSSWEANYARFLEFQLRQGLIQGWEYEPETFWFEKIRRGVRSYLPDFRITELNGAVYYVEVKGWMDARSQTKIKRMAKYYPHIDLRVVGAREYRELANKLGGAIPHWERAA